MNELWTWLKKNPKITCTVILPAVLTAVVGIFTVFSEIYKAYVYDVNIGKGSYASEQVVLWQKNANCMQNAQFTMVKNQNNIEVGSLVCQSGDVLISVKRPDAITPSFKWVSWDNVSAEANKTSKISLFPVANADILMCQVWLSPVILQQRIATQYGCYDITIHTPTGQTLSYVQVDCRRGCS